jgi:5-methyltetrahydropteroyltriglutamate--homocysteine methyltransferase
MLKTTIAGSLPKPSWLAEPEELWAPWRLEGEELEQGKRDAALVWIKEEEDAGIDIVTEGEQFRMHAARDRSTGLRPASRAPIPNAV